MGGLGCMVLVYAAALGWELPSLRPIWLAPRSSPCCRRADGGGRLFRAQPAVLGRKRDALAQCRGRRAPLGRGQVASLVVSDRELPGVLDWPATPGAASATTGVLRGYNYSNGRFVTLNILTKRP